MWCVLRDAITASRLEKLGGEQYRYDFESPLDYPTDSYTMSFADLVANENGMQRQNHRILAGRRGRVVAKKQQKSLSLIKKIEKIAVSFGLHFRVRNEAQRCTVDTVADSIRGFRVVCKYMTEMGVAGSAADFCASHSET